MRITATYLLASRRRGTLYVGSALDLLKRMEEHKSGAGSSFTARYGVYSLVWFQEHALVTEARSHEYQIKNWRRDWKIQLIEAENPDWRDLHPVLAASTM